MKGQFKKDTENLKNGKFTYNNGDIDYDTYDGGVIEFLDMMRGYPYSDYQTCDPNAEEYGKECIPSYKRANVNYKDNLPISGAVDKNLGQCYGSENSPTKGLCLGCYGGSLGYEYEKNANGEEIRNSKGRRIRKSVFERVSCQYKYVKLKKITEFGMPAWKFEPASEFMKQKTDGTFERYPPGSERDANTTQSSHTNLTGSSHVFTEKSKHYNRFIGFTILDKDGQNPKIITGWVPKSSIKIFTAQKDYLPIKGFMWNDPPITPNEILIGTQLISKDGTKKITVGEYIAPDPSTVVCNDCGESSDCIETGGGIYKCGEKNNYCVRKGTVNTCQKPFNTIDWVDSKLPY